MPEDCTRTVGGLRLHGGFFGESYFDAVAAWSLEVWAIVGQQADSSTAQIAISHGSSFTFMAGKNTKPTRGCYLL